VSAHGLPQRVVVAEPFAQSGLTVLRDGGIVVESLVGRSRDELKASLAQADALIVRSETRVDGDLLAAAPRLRVVARAGVGVDAIDVEAATAAGILVLNTPAANTLAATEQTFALMLSLVRKTADAVGSIRAGRWERTPFIGTELYGKALGIVGLGRIGGNVAQRARAFGMRILAHDPFINAQRAASFEAELLSLDALLAQSDIVTLHVPLTAQTVGMIDGGKLARMQAHAVIVNCARGGVIVEEDLLVALDAETIAGAAIDVVAKEPPPPDGSGARLHRHPRVVATPHLGGSTHEALERIAIELASDVVRALVGRPASGSVNAPVPGGPDAERSVPFVDVADRIGRFYPQWTTMRELPSFTLVMEGELADADPAPFVTAFLAGLLQTVTDRRVSVVNADAVARELGLTVTVLGEPRGGTYARALRVRGGATTIRGTAIDGRPRIVALDEFEIDATPVGAMVITRHRDVPGMIGRVGTILGEADVNISTMQVSRTTVGGDAIMVLSVDRPVDAATIERLRLMESVSSVHALTL